MAGGRWEAHQARRTAWSLYVETPTRLVICPVEGKGEIISVFRQPGYHYFAQILWVWGKEYLIRVLQEPHSDIGQTAQVHYDGEMVSEAV